MGTGAFPMTQFDPSPPCCHSERSEESQSFPERTQTTETLRYAQGDTQHHRQMARACFVLVCLVCLFSSLPAASAQVTNSAAALIPFDAMTETNRLLVRGVTDHYTLRREYAVTEFTARLGPLEFLVDHMDACSVLAQSVGLIRYRATRDGDDRIVADDHEGAAGYILETLRHGGKRVYYLAGSERGLFDVSGRAVAVVEFSQPKPDTIDYTGAMFIKVDNIVMAALTQLFSLFLRSTVDDHYQHVLGNPIVLSQIAYKDPRSLLTRIEAMPPADRQLLAPFAELLRSPPAK
jgi:hypothetical protein